MHLPWFVQIRIQFPEYKIDIAIVKPVQAEIHKHTALPLDDTEQQHFTFHFKKTHGRVMVL